MPQAAAPQSISIVPRTQSSTQTQAPQYQASNNNPETQTVSISITLVEKDHKDDFQADEKNRK